ncbi:hypothetical protein B0J14DRAFT_633862 [Halenospora varia]|nr:hypothetical protein B0J14DRAFT_633862 [Halenospora varia]
MSLQDSNRIAIDPSGTCIINVIDNESQDNAIKASFRVSQQALIEHTNVETLTTWSHFWDAQTSTITIGYESIQGMTIWLSIIHNTPVIDPNTIRTDHLTDAIRISQKFATNTAQMEEWLKKFVNSIDLAQYSNPNKRPYIIVTRSWGYILSYVEAFMEVARFVEQNRQPILSPCVFQLRNPISDGKFIKYIYSDEVVDHWKDLVRFTTTLFDRAALPKYSQGFIAYTDTYDSLTFCKDSDNACAEKKIKALDRNQMDAAQVYVLFEKFENEPLDVVRQAFHSRFGHVPDDDGCRRWMKAKLKKAVGERSEPFKSMKAYWTNKANKYKVADLYIGKWDEKEKGHKTKKRARAIADENEQSEENTRVTEATSAMGSMAIRDDNTEEGGVPFSG